jgi:hypothetical protein
VAFELNLHGYSANAGRAGLQAALQVKNDDIAQFHIAPTITPKRLAVHQV